MDDGVGRTLREARTERGIDLAEIVAVTKIRKEYLRAIEADEWDRLPGDTYARAFIRTYASHLGLDGEELAERQRRERDGRGQEPMPQVEPEPLTVAMGWRRRAGGIPAWAVGALAAALMLVLLIVLVSGGGGGGGPAAGGGASQGAGAQALPGARGAETALPAPGHTVRLTATAEVWVCLLDARGEPLIDGQILAPGSSEGPYRSGNFTLSLGNGEVTMMVDGEQASIPETPSPVGFSIEGGSLRPLSESERPTCT
jgi:hypothetical protein